MTDLASRYYRKWANVGLNQRFLNNSTEDIDQKEINRCYIIEKS